MRNSTSITEGFDSLPDAALVSAKTYAALLGVHRNSLRRMEAAGKVPASVKLSEQTVRFRVGDIRNALANLKSA